MTVLRGAVDLTCHLAQVRARSNLRQTPVPFDRCEGWVLRDGRLVHESGHFFSIVGMRGLDMAGDGTATDAPMIDQPEVGWLGFVVRMTDAGVEWLMQAKTEPGNLNDTHLAPTLQATRSNYERVHGGAPSAFLESFQDRPIFVSDSAQSEQGSRFLWKFNRNSVIALGADTPLTLPQSGQWAWSTSAGLRAALSLDLTVNTDARSVIASAPWALLSDGKPLFSAESLARSYARPCPDIEFDRVVSRLAPQLPDRTTRWHTVPLEALTHHRMTPDALLDAQGDEIVSSRSITVEGREVAAWCQPFMLSPQQSVHDLYARNTRVGAQVFVRLLQEPGFGPRREYGPSRHSLYATPSDMLPWKTGAVLAQIDQSDEGGRFMQARARYRIVEITDAPERRRWPFGEWVTLATLERLAVRPGTTTNELRTLVSLILGADCDAACAAL